MSTLKFHYQFTFEDQTEISYKVDIDSSSNVAEPKDHSNLPPWTELGCHQCPDCPLKSQDHPHCPIAVNLYELAETFKDHKSHLPCLVSVESNQRTYSKRVSLQEGLGSLFGLLMATSQCPAMDFLKPMAHFHLPFSSLEETMMRAASLYLLRQYFAKVGGKKADWEMKDLESHYQRINHVNKHVAERIRALKDRKGDANSNAIMILDTLARLLNMELKNNFTALQDCFVEPKKKAS